MDNILLLKTQYLEFNSYSLLVKELTIYEYLKLLKSLKDHDSTIFRGFLLSWCVAGTVPKMISAHDGEVIESAIIELNSCKDLLLSNRNNGDSTKDPEECPDSSALQMLDVIAQHYKTDPLELAKKYSYRQAIYLFVLATNAKIDAVYANGGKIAGAKHRPHINARGMIVDLQTLPPAEQKAYHLRILKSCGVIKK